MKKQSQKTPIRLTPKLRRQLDAVVLLGPVTKADFRRQLTRVEKVILALQEEYQHGRR